MVIITGNLFMPAMRRVEPRLSCHVHEKPVYVQAKAGEAELQRIISSNIPPGYAEVRGRVRGL